MDSNLFETREMKHRLDKYNVELRYFALNMKNSLFLWIGDEKGSFDGLSVCLPMVTSSGYSDQSGTFIYSSNGSSSNSLSLFEQNLAKKLSKRLNYPCFVSLSLNSKLNGLNSWDSLDLAENETFGCLVEQNLFENLNKLVIVDCK